MDSEDEALNKEAIKKTYWIYNEDMVLLESRIKSFEDSNLKIKQTPQQLAEAGFYYMGLEDQCVCFHCGLGVEEWEPEDDPWFEHAFHTPHCAFLNLKKSELKFQIGEKEQVLPLEAMNQAEPLDIYLCVLESFVKSDAFKDSPFGPVHFLVDRVVIRNSLGQVEIEKEKVLHLALNLLAIARDTPTLQDHLGYLVSVKV
ncbi:death-associated inhibitor of apoptosis 1-like [Folsomia candida]|uniref:death-associated inhibitor of apoptosis 1-like n=1 Tax=Folsomia candida TaxID=158441 RepID=UPI000B8F1FBB|nr:death-associated inhibitor of apoptosis 1-like [Folsomia candida]